MGSGEVFWLMLSLLAKPVEDQIKILGGLPEEGDPLCEDYVNNSASKVIATLQTYYAGWYDEFFPNCKNAEILFDLINGGRVFKLSKRDFIDGEEWGCLRKQAKLSLEEVDLEPLPVPSRIEFDQYIETY